MAHAASDKKKLVSLGFNDFAISVSAVHDMFKKTA